MRHIPKYVDLPKLSHSRADEAKGYGIAKYPDEKVTPATLFNAASMTKAFISSAVSLLVDDDDHPDVQWTTPVSKLIRDDFVLSNSQYTEMVTVEDILSHRSGLPEWVNFHRNILPVDWANCFAAKTMHAWESMPRNQILQRALLENFAISH